jgi:hypothetical protein
MSDMNDFYDQMMTDCFISGTGAAKVTHKGGACTNASGANNNSLTLEKMQNAMAMLDASRGLSHASIEALISESARRIDCDFSELFGVKIDAKLWAYRDTFAKPKPKPLPPLTQSSDMAGIERAAKLPEPAPVVVDPVSTSKPPLAGFESIAGMSHRCGHWGA